MKVKIKLLMRDGTKGKEAFAETTDPDRLGDRLAADLPLDLVGRVAAVQIIGPRGVIVTQVPIAPTLTVG